MVSNLFVLMMKALHTRWETGLHNSFLLASSVLIAILLSLFCPLFSKILGFFFPLLISTSVCSMAVYLFILSGKEAAKEVFFSNGENSAPRVIKVYDEINCGVYNNKIRVACFFFKSDIGWSNSLPGEDGEPINFAGKLQAGNGTGAFDEGVELLKVDNMAEGVWNYYLGRSSKWHYYQKSLMYEIAQ
nr:PREDICTED: uncharacterized protein LOC108951185 [Musa acuminata subsp. malaccensis]